MSDLDRPIGVESVASGLRALRSPMAMAMLQVFAGFAALALAAQVRVPVPGTDVPGTLQLLAVVLCGLMLSPGRAVSSVLLYLGMGVAGLPVFAAGSAGIIGPTGGYLVGFLVAVWVIATVRGRGDNPSLGLQSTRYLLAGVAGTSVVFALGLAWRAVLLDSWATVLSTGLFPFLLKGMTEVILAVAVVMAGRRLAAELGWQGR
ncbi:MAG: biotin transporter BioY [Planctomycetota bacterium]|jgi:biotin transport system substrate-specific component